MRRNQRRNNQKKFETKTSKILLILFVIILFVLCVFTIQNILSLENAKKLSKNNNEKTIIETINREDNIQNDNIKTKPITFKLTSLGDTLCHNTQYWDAYNSSTKEYDFSYVYKDISSYTSSADLTIGSLETSFAGEDRGYSNYPTFNSPDSLATALKNIGVELFLQLVIML